MQKFNYHSHTYRCNHADLDYTDEEYVLDYIKMGFDKIAFTDHCPQKNEIDKRTTVRMKYNQKNEYLESINKLKSKYLDKIEIKSGYEIEFLPGEEKNILELKNEVDKIVLGQHFVYGKNRELKHFSKGIIITDEDLFEYSKYIDRAMELQIPDILGHPDLFMKNRNNFGEVEEVITHQICKSAEKYNIPLEINLSNIFNTVYYKDGVSMDEEKVFEKLKKVKYPNKSFWEIASNYNVKVLYGLDTHHRGQITSFNKLVNLSTEIIGKDIIDKLNFIEEV